MRIFFWQGKKLACSRGMTLPEVLLAMIILAPVLVLGIKNFAQCAALTEQAVQSSRAVAAVKNRIAAIENTAYASVYSTYHNTTFTVTGLNGIGLTEVDNTDPNLLIVHVEFSWRDRRGRVIGEDLDLDGIRDNGEDVNGNGRLDSIAMATTCLYNM